jgi:spermidine synthase
MQSVTGPCVGLPTPAIRLVLGLVGFSAIMGQIVLMRELIVVFNGNEISLGIMLATWLLWTAAGSSLANWITFARLDTRKIVAALECLLGTSLLPTIWILRASRAFFQTVPGELVGPIPMMLTSLVCLSGFCVLSGCLFVVAAHMYQAECAVPDHVAMSSAYLLDAAGSGLGGILASLFLLRFFESFQIAIVVALLNLFVAAILFSRGRRTGIVAVALAAAVFAVPLLIYVAPWLNKSSQQRLWRGFHVLSSRDSIYGNMAVIETGNIRSIYDNGVILASAPDEAAAEEAVHFALLEHPAPKRVLLIGGGVNGSIAQALKHPTLERLDYVELDPALIEVTKQFFPATSLALADPRVHLHYADGRRYLKTTPDRFDVIILDLPDPQTAQLNRFYTEEFFRLARDHLAPGGLLALQLRSSEDYISPDLAEYLRCIQHTLRQVFPYSAVIPGETIHFFGAVQAGVLTDDPQMLISRLRNRNLDTQYVREYFIPFRMTPDRMTQIHELLQLSPTTPINRDFEPIAYYFDVVLWSAQFKSGYSRWFRIAGHTVFMHVIGRVLVILLFLAVVLAYLPTRRTRARASAAYCVAATGFTLMALQIFLLLAFQSVYGYVYHQLAILIAMFMAGIALGSWLGIRRLRSSGSPALRAITTTQFLLAISGPALILAVSSLSQISSLTAALLIAQFIFPAFAVASGMLGGYQFPVAMEIYLGDSSPGPRLGTLYAIDLLGGCIGALLLSGYLIPVFGFWKTAWLSAAVNLAPALLAARIALEAKEFRA